MSILPPARLEAIALFCIQEFRQFPPTQLVMVAFDSDGQLTGTIRRLQPLEQRSTEQLLQSMRQAQAASVLLASLSPWPLVDPEQCQCRFHQVNELLERSQAQGIELLDCLFVQGLNYCSLRAETDLWYAVCA